MRSPFIPQTRSCVWMLLLIALAPAAAQAEWVDERTVDIFQIRSEFELGDSEGIALLAEMQQLREDVERLLGLEAGSDPIEVNLFETRRSYQNFLSVRVPGAAARAALFVKGADKGRVYVHRHRDFTTDVRHECTHAVLHNALPYVPLWLDEGLAEYFEVPAPLRADSNPHLKSIRWALRLRWNPSLTRLEQKRELSSMNADDYRDSWAWIHYMLHGPAEPRQVLANYLYDIQIGNPAGKLSERLAQEIPGVHSTMIDHFKQWR